MDQERNNAVSELKAIRIALASPEQVKAWSFGEVTKAETINYRTLRPEKDGLFCERIFGPTKDWECYCGKYKKVRFKGVVCDRCGVEVTRSRVRRERMGHIKLASPVAHIWYFKGTPSHIGMLLDITPRDLERVLYFSRYIITHISEDKKRDLLVQLESERREILENLSHRYGHSSDSKSYEEDLLLLQEQFALYDIKPQDIETLFANAPTENVAMGSGVIDSIAREKTGVRIILRNGNLAPKDFTIPPTHKPCVKTGSHVNKGDVLMTVTKRALAKAKKEGSEIEQGDEIISTLSGTAKVTKEVFYILPDAETVRSEGSENNVGTTDINLPFSAKIRAKKGQIIKEGDFFTEPSELEKISHLYNNLYILKMAEADLSLSETQEILSEDQYKDLLKMAKLEPIKVQKILTEEEYKSLRERLDRDLFSAEMGAEAILEILKVVNLDKLKDKLQSELISASGQRHGKIVKRLRVVDALRKSGNKPEWMVITLLPVLPPDLHPMVQLDGGRFATSDLNELYRRVINRNNRLKNLINIQAPEIIIRNEKRMLQEAVDSLIDNGRHGRAAQSAHNHQLKSLTDLLRGKQGRFRQNLLGKRVDYSGRSVIVVGPSLKLDECGLPRKMALELFKPFVMNALVLKGHAHNIKSAKRLAEQLSPEVWDILEEVTRDHPVILNRAPTLHRLGIQAFKIVLVDGLAIQIHPLVCAAFNADFDGDQMAVHVPLSKEARQEALKLMLSSNNLLAPRSGDPIVAPTLDMVLGIYYLTQAESGPENQNGSNGHAPTRLKAFSDFDDALLAYDAGHTPLRGEIRVRDGKGEMITTTPGRIIFNNQLPREMGFRNHLFGRSEIENLIAECHANYDNETVVKMLDVIKDVGFKYATMSGTTISITDITTPQAKRGLIQAADRKIKTLEDQFLDGFISREDQYKESVKIWTDVSEKMTLAIQKDLKNYGGIYDMSASGAKGNITQIKQMAGMRGLMSNPRGRIIEMPIKSSFAEGLSVMEYFISTHGTRKGLADTALRTADAGYLTRRLADVAQNVIILEEDCGRNAGTSVVDNKEEDLRIAERIVFRYPALPIAHPETGEILVDTDTLITPGLSKAVQEAGVTTATVRSPLSCSARKGICAKCYGASLATNKPCMVGQAVGIIAAESIGEPGTQLTMRTFHTGGVAGRDITSGLPRVVELFEAREPKGVAPITEIAGIVNLIQTQEGRVAKVTNGEKFSHEVPIPSNYRPSVKTGDTIFVGQTILRLKKSETKKSSDQEVALPHEINAEVSGDVKVTKQSISIIWEERTEKVYPLPATARILVENGGTVQPGEAFTNGPRSPKEILRVEGPEATQRYMVKEVQKVYKTQGVNIHDKHIEVIIRQMLRKVQVETPGDTDLLPQETISKTEYQRVNQRIVKKGGQPATARPLLLGVTRAALSTDSFLASASFQETARVLTDAAIAGTVDHLEGLKENVILGNLIPARLGRTEEGRELLGLPEKSNIRVNQQLEADIDAPQTYGEALARISREGRGRGQEEYRRAAEDYFKSQNN